MATKLEFINEGRNIGHCWSLQRHVGVKVHLERGVTLIELLIALAVVTIGMLLIGPNIGNFSGSARLSSTANEMQNAIVYARSEAIRLNAAVVFCQSSDGLVCSTPSGGRWQGWLVRAAGPTLGTETGAVLRANLFTDDAVQVSSDTTLQTAGDAIRFNNLGLLRTFANSAPLSARLRVCIPSISLNPHIYDVNFNSGGRMQVTTSSNSGSCS